MDTALNLNNSRLSHGGHNKHRLCHIFELREPSEGLRDEICMDLTTRLDWDWTRLRGMPAWTELAAATILARTRDASLQRAHSVGLGKKKTIEQGGPPEMSDATCGQDRLG